MILEELKSKKWRSMVLAIAAMLFEQSQSSDWYTTVCVTVVASVYLIAQGLADMGKSRMKVLVDAAERGAIEGKAVAKNILEEVGEEKTR